jgi:hypothetical protein
MDKLSPIRILVEILKFEPKRVAALKEIPLPMFTKFKTDKDFPRVVVVRTLNVEPQVT